MSAISLVAIARHMLTSKVDCVPVAKHKQYLLDVDSLVVSPTLHNTPLIPLTPFRLKRRLLLILGSILNSILIPRYLYS